MTAPQVHMEEFAYIYKNLSRPKDYKSLKISPLKSYSPTSDLHDYQEGLTVSSPHVFTTHLVLKTLKCWSTCLMPFHMLRVYFLVAVLLLLLATLNNWTQNIFVEISAQNNLSINQHVVLTFWI